MFRQERRRLARKVLTLGILVLCLVTLSTPLGGLKAYADTACYDFCDEQKSACDQNCVDSSPCPGPSCAPAITRCLEGCDNQWNSCVARCNSSE